MKSVIISLFIAAVMIIGSIVYEKHMDTVSQNLLTINEKAITALENDNYEEASKILFELTSYLENKRTLLTATDNHEVLNEIESAIYELTEFIDGQQKYDALSKFKVLKFLFHKMPLNYKIRLENIL